MSDNGLRGGPRTERPPPSPENRRRRQFDSDIPSHRQAQRRQSDENRRFNQRRSHPPRRGDRRFDDHAGPGRKPPPPPEREFAEGAGGRLQVFLADRSHSLIVGRNVEPDSIHWLAITVGGHSDDKVAGDGKDISNQIVGYLGYRKTQEITTELDQLFIDKLERNLTYSLVFIIVLAAFIALYVARLLVKPVLRLRKAARAVADGQFDTQIKVSSRDEIGDLCQDFNQLAESLAGNLKARQLWIADISHELRTPVSILRGELEALQDGIRPITRESVNSLHQEIIQLTRLINDLHELSLSDIGALSYQFKRTELMSLIDGVIDSRHNDILESQFKISHLKLSSPIYVNADEQRLAQLFLNLLSNTLVYSSQPGSLKVSYQCDKQNVVILWSDSEPGVTDQQLTQLFDRLYRVDSSRNRNRGGSGLGLAICKNITKAHRGMIKAVHSESGGITFIITLPLDSPG